MHRDRAQRSVRVFLAALFLASSSIAQPAAAQTVADGSDVCGTVGAHDPALCGFPALSGNPTPAFPEETVIANALAGSNVARSIVRFQFTDGVAVPYVRLNADPCDGFLSNGDGTCSGIVGRTPVDPFTNGADTSLNEVLTDEQEALLGCGPLWGTDCERDGIDLTNAEASVLLQSWPGFQGGVPGSRWVNGEMVVLPGARGPSDPSYNSNVDGCSAPGCNLAVPYTGNLFQSEMAALSWNFMMTLVAFSQSPDPTQPDPRYFQPNDPVSTAPAQCSFAQPQYCASVQAFFQLPEPDGALVGVAALLALAARTRRR